MKIITRNDYLNILSGANLMGTGGGGTISGGKKILKKAGKKIKLVSFNEMNDGDLICSVYGIGGKEKCDPVIAANNALEIFQKNYAKAISAIVPVEIGAESVAISFLIASILDIPVLDSDVVGMRSSPEIYLETITLGNLKRTPCSIADDKGNFRFIEKNLDIKSLEINLRNFAVRAGGDAFVAGYPLRISDAKKVMPFGSITEAEKTGKAIKQLKINDDINAFTEQSSWVVVDTGLVISQKNTSKGGFEVGEYLINSPSANYKVIYKNENLVLLKNLLVYLTCPDSIGLLDINSFEGVNNFEENKGRKVAIIAKKAIRIWRTEKGKELFSPKRLGLQFEQKLL